ncbi:SusC/RagA family TonB-linked outer membrane protein [Maribellus luteus]|uniref:SusC/RagA family TonB-linked outer membrane protein n=1 Tax=Maribellus luteus TaxID=2305463 RepID=A0A399T3U9_9BACT|nr:TonB-dependent receptor [Maribellus luteus]RIJ50548.1 SusC/RagA family TonB-linked outer membrane protein [Maribellus luteus]
MKKNRLNRLLIFYRSLCKLLLIMKITIAFILISGLWVQASVYSQSTKLSLDMKDAFISQVFTEIENQSNFRFVYFNDLFDLERKITLNVKDQKIEDILNGIFTDSSISYKVLEDNLIVFLPGIQQQSNTIKGNVTNQLGEPIPGASIIIKGTNSGTITDTDGNFQLTVSDTKQILSVSFIGMKTVEISIQGEKTISIVLEENTIGVEEVVVVGFGERRKKDLTGSISTVGAGVMEKLSTASPQFALQGNTTGVRIVNTSGDPNAAPQIYVRGIGTWQGSGQPLYVIDGQIITPPDDGNMDILAAPNRDTPPNLWTLINPNDIASISVLKDASAAAVYGSRGANGVILITTKKGKSGGPTIEFEAYRGIQNIPTFKMLNTQQYIDIVEEMYSNNLNPDITIENQLYGRNQNDENVRLISYSPQFDSQSPFYISSRKTYNWQDELIRSNAIDESYDLKVSGATPKTNYYLSTGYKNQDGAFHGNNLKRYTAAFNLNTEVKPWLKTGVNYKFALQEISMDDYDDLPGIAGVAPWQPLKDPNNKYGFAPVIDAHSTEDWHARKIYGQGSRDNYLALSELDKNDFDLMRQMGHAHIELLPIKGLTLRGSLNIDYTTQDRNSVTTYSRSNVFRTVGRNPAEEAPTAKFSLGRHSSRVNNIFNYQSDFTATYDKFFKKHRLTLTAAVQDQYHVREVRDMQGDNLTENLNDLDKINYDGDLANNNSFYFKRYKYWFGIVGRANYIYDEKYYLDISYRRDGSSGFAKDYRWGDFYSISGAWRISSESFMQSLTFIDDLKIRGGWGEAGNDETVVGKYAYLSQASGAGSYRWGSGGGDPLGNYNHAVPVSGFPNAELTWEIASTTYVGFDALFFGNKLNLTVEVFNRKTDGIQQFVNLPLTVGTQDPAFNIGVLENKGVDISLGFNNKIGEFTYGISGNISFLQNEIVDIYDDQPFYVTDQFGNTRRVEEGRSIGHIWGYKVGGMFQTQEEIDAYYTQITDKTIINTDYVAPGDLYFQDIGGAPTEDEKFYSKTPDGNINDYDQTEIGNTIPGYTYGLSLNASWQNFDLSMSFYGEGDVDRYNEVKNRLEGMSSLGNNFTTAILNRWTPQNTSTDIPRAVIGDPAKNNRYSDRFIESAAFFRLNNWQLGYSLPDNLFEKINYAVRSVRVYIGGQNNIYLSKWSGIDPVNDRKPLPRTFNVGLKAKF